MATAPAFDPSTLTPEYINAINYRGQIAASVFFIVALTLTFALRTVSRINTGNAKWGWDDILIIPAYIACIGMCVLGLVSALYGNVGRHMIALLATQGPEGLVPVFKSVFAVAPIWLIANALPKLSILALYLRIFPTVPVKRVCYFLIAFICANCVGCIIAACFICIPLEAWWDHTVPGKCYDFTAFFVAVNVPHIFADLCILIVPLPVLFRLNLDNYKKVGIIITFLAGSIGVIGSCYRLAIFVNQSHDPEGDFTWEAADGITWSIVEPGMCFMAACFLTFRPLGKLFAASRFGKKALSLLSITGRTSHTSRGTSTRGTRDITLSNPLKRERKRGWESVSGSEIKMDSIAVGAGAPASRTREDVHDGAIRVKTDISVTPHNE